jgi:hypothetical protein
MEQERAAAAALAELGLRAAAALPVTGLCLFEARPAREHLLARRTTLTNRADQEPAFATPGFRCEAADRRSAVEQIP